MKKLRTIVLVVLLVAGFSSIANAQFSVGANAGVAMPVGSFEQKFNMGFGGYADVAYSLNEHMSIGFNIGFYSFKGTDYPAGSNPSTRILPVFADYKYYLDTEGFMPYVGMGLGMYVVYSSITTPEIPANVVGGVTLAPAIPKYEHLDNYKKFGISPTVGFWIGDELKYGASVTYHITFFDASNIGINIGILYPFGQ
jgi:hypothetical protein